MATPSGLKTGLVLLTLLLLAGLAVYQWGGFGSQSESAQPAAAKRAGGMAGGGRSAPPAPVAVAAVTRVANDVLIEVTGSGMALRSATLRPASAGEVQSVAFKAGQRVRAGQVLLRLDDRNQRLAVDAAANQLEAARRLLARFDDIAGAGAVPASQIDSARTAVTSAEIALAQARAALADRMLLAPFSGITGLAEVQPGDRVSTDTVVTTLDDRSALRVAFAVPEVHIARMAAGQEVALTHSAYPGRRFSGRIQQIDSRIDAETRTVRIQAQVPNADDVLRAGMAFQLSLKLGGGMELAVPELAVQWGRQGPYVWMVRDADDQQTADQMPVQVLRRMHGLVLLRPAAEATRPLQTGEQVVVEGVQRMRQGAAMTILGNAASAQAATGPTGVAPVSAPGSAAGAAVKP